jgi:hypothetical protein
MTAGIITLLSFSCSQPQTTVNLKKPPSSYADTIIISGESAVFYTPDSIQLIKIKAVNKKMIYESLMHDCFFQMRNARLVILRDRPGVKITQVSKVRWLVFVMKNKSKRLIDLNTINDICGIYLFDGNKEPELIDMTNVETDLGFYFQK